MKRLFLAAAIAALMDAGAAMAEVPTYERNGFPITPHQFRVLGSESVRERAPASTLTLDGMPASPHQLKALGRDSPSRQDTSSSAS